MIAKYVSAVNFVNRTDYISYVKVRSNIGLG